MPLPKFIEADVVESRTERGVTQICDIITRDNGDFRAIFKDVRLRPLLIMHFAGFQAYAKHMRE